MIYSFGEKLKRIREENGWSQEEIADILGTSKQVISRYENEQRIPKIDTAVKYSFLLHIPVNYLVDESFPYTNTTDLNISNYEKFYKDYSWGKGILVAYETSSPEIQAAACAVLGIPRVIPPQQQNTYADSRILEIAAHNDDGNDEELNAAMPAILKALDEQEKKDNARDERIRKNNK